MPSETQLLERLEAALPVDDIVAWLLAEFPGSGEREIMGMLQVIYAGSFTIRPASSSERHYAVGEEGWDACPQRVERG